MVTHGSTMDAQDVGVTPLWMVLICLFGGNRKSVRENEWNEQQKELLDGRERRRTAIEGRGVCLTTDYTYKFQSECYALHFASILTSLLSGLSLGGSHHWNTETEEHPDHLRRHRKCDTLVWGAHVIIHSLYKYVYFGAMVSCLPYTVPVTWGSVTVVEPQL